MYIELIKNGRKNGQTLNFFVIHNEKEIYTTFDNILKWCTENNIDVLYVKFRINTHSTENIFVTVASEIFKITSKQMLFDKIVNIINFEFKINLNHCYNWYYLSYTKHFNLKL